MQINPYLFFKGQCEEAFKFYAKLFGGKIAAMMPHTGSPAEGHVPPDWGKKIMHARLVVGDMVLMGSDPPPDRYNQPKGFSITLGVPDPGEAERVFKGLADGGNVTMALDKTFFADRFGMLVDRFGIPWMVICEKQA